MKAEGNPILDEGFIKFSEIKPQHYEEAFEAGLKEQDENIAAITANTEAPTFENTILALEYSDETLNKVCNILFNMTEAETSDALDSLAAKYSPILTQKNNEIMLNEELFKRVKEVYDQRESLNLDTEDRKVLEDTYISFLRSGANLSKEDKARMDSITTALSSLTLQYGQNVLKETNSFSMTLTKPEEIAGLPGYVLDAASQRAKEAGKEGYLFNLSMPSYSAFMKFADNRELRKKLYIAYNSKGNRGGENNNNSIVRDIVNKRLELARIMGRKTFAEYKLERTMAENTENVYKLLDDLYSNYMPVARKEVDELNDYARRLTSDANFKIEPWDWAYYSEKLQEEKYNLNEGMLKPYFELDRVKKGVFNLAGKLYGLKFTLNNSIDKYHKDVEVYDVTDADGNYVATFYADFFPRSTKQGGAWMTEFRGQHIKDGKNIRPYVSIVTNFSIPTDSTPSLLSFGEVTTLLHEFGHSLHGMLANTKYASHSGTNVSRDFVELPSQIMENFAYEKCFLDDVAI
ncbi:MAG: M3 family metallopeptidase, partial [Paludibacteraceae bacterium]|nr:M3 family metallopeptidase [Paludibacteraceae bacterium]